MEEIAEEKQTETCICQRWPMLVIALTFSIFGVVGMIVSYSLWQEKALEHKHHYGIVIDAGSSHTDINIYKWPSSKKYQGTANVQQVGFATCSDVGISSLKDDLSKVSSVINGCIKEYALSKIPKHNRNHTPIYVGATAGMRLLCARDKDSCEKIMATVRKTLRNYMFDTKTGDISVLSGKDEGTYGWITVNLLKDRIPKKKGSRDMETIGGLDMGGASAEISFIPKQGTIVPNNYRSFIRLYGRNYTLYTHSFLCYGMNEAERRVLASIVQKSNYSTNIRNPCYPQGYARNVTAQELWLHPCSMKPKSSIFPTEDSKIYTFYGGSNYELCRKIVTNLFNETSCNFGSCSFDGVYQPNVTGKFVAYSGYAFVSDFFNLTDDDGLNKLSEASRQFCDENWTTILKEHPSASVKFLPKNCFNSVYIYQILTYGFHFKRNSHDIKFKKKLNDKEVGWSLGLMVNASNLIPTEGLKRKISHQDFVFFTALSVVVIAFGIMLCFCFSIKRCRALSQKRYQVINNDG